MVAFLSEAVDGEELESNGYAGGFCSTLTLLRWLTGNCRDRKAGRG